MRRSGLEAEEVAANYLKSKGFTIIHRNWRTKLCEIDIVARKHNILYFTEVKYRQASTSGSGLDYITSKKLQQMSRAAELWVNAHDWDGNYMLAAIEVSGSDFTITAFIESVS